MLEYKLRELIKPQKCVGARVTESWTLAATRSFEPLDNRLKAKCADVAAHAVSKYLYDEDKFRWDREPEGRVCKVDIFFFTYDDLYDLLNQAAKLGENYTIRYNPVIVGKV